MEQDCLQEGSLAYMPPRLLSQLAQISGPGSDAAASAVQCEVQSVANRAAADVLALASTTLKQPAIEELQVHATTASRRPYSMRTTKRAFETVERPACCLLCKRWCCQPILPAANLQAARVGCAISCKTS